MAYTSYPFDNQDTTESQYSALFRELQDSGCIGDGKGACVVTANASAMSVTMSAGNAIVRGHYFTSDAVVTLPIGAAGATVRYDAVVLQLNPATNTITPTVKANAGQNPALTETDTGVFELLLAVVTVPASAVTIAAADVADRRSYVGIRVGVWNNATRPTAPRNYRTGFNTDRGYLEFWNGSVWSLVPAGAQHGMVVPTPSTATVVAPGAAFIHTTPAIAVPPNTRLRGTMRARCGLANNLVQSFGYGTPFTVTSGATIVATEYWHMRQAAQAGDVGSYTMQADVIIDTGNLSSIVVTAQFTNGGGNNSATLDSPQFFYTIGSKAP